MFVIIGYIIVLLAVFGGYAIAGGHFGVLAVAAPVETLIIGGAALGAFLVGDNQEVLMATLRALPRPFTRSRASKARHTSPLALPYAILPEARQEGLMSIEP